jgi:hypothetical protein
MGIQNLDICSITWWLLKMQSKFGLISEFMGDFNFKTFDQTVLALNVQEFLDKLNFKLVK